MAYEIAQVTNSGGRLAHQNMLLAIKALAEANGWVTLRYDGVSADHELILQGEGLSGTEEIFVGFRCYQDVGADYYNLLAGTFNGYVSGNTFDTQPGARLSGVPAHNTQIDYFLVANAQRIALCLKVGVGAYESAYVGKMLPYARPGEFPSPLVNAGMLAGAAATRYSDTIHSMAFKGNRTNFALRDQAGAWRQVYTHPWGNTTFFSGSAAPRPTADVYFPAPITLYDGSPNVFGILDGLFYVTGFDLFAERVLQVGGSYTVDDAGKTVSQVVNEIVATAGGRGLVVLRDVTRTSFNDYFALEMI